MTEKRTIKVYMDDGRIFEYDVEAGDAERVAAKVREHCAAIAAGGYRHNDGDEFEHYPAWRILKVKARGVPTHYLDRPSGT